MANLNSSKNFQPWWIFLATVPPWHLRGGMICTSFYFLTTYQNRIRLILAKLVSINSVCLFKAYGDDGALEFLLTFLNFYDWLWTLTQHNDHLFITVATDHHPPFPRWTENKVQKQVQRLFMVCLVIW